ncbi:zinc finger CCCH domain-containing protein 25 [Carex littledalei]|uniref:Zinc finger CCCH domain-containing protein 25 n=1 Tax=Carex littledalei TaxID=544730 RepID=A0A833RLT0_9POAL|nr:zinc finger CCCH domain-containing protein 25 [Carex littledalei]
MNPLTLVKRTQKITSTEAALGISDEASWHAKYKDSAYVFVGGLSYDLTEGDLLAVFSQYGEIMDVNLVRDKGTGKSKGFAFIAYEDQRSTILAVDNLNGARVSGRIVRVDHVSKYKKKEEEDEDNDQEKKEARGVCYAFQKGECNRGASCKFSHQEPRETGDPRWGRKASDSAWENDQFDKEQEKRKAPGVCYAFQKGECNRGASCKFSHQEPRETGDQRWGRKASDSAWENDKFDEETRHNKRERRSSPSSRDGEIERKRKDERGLDRRDDRQRNEMRSSSRYYDRDDERDRRSSRR